MELVSIQDLVDKLQEIRKAAMNNAEHLMEISKDSKFPAIESIALWDVTAQKIQRIINETEAHVRAIGGYVKVNND
jgi:hypothetical protein